MELRNGKISKWVVRGRFPLQRLPDELCLEVLGDLSTCELLIVARTSKHMRALCIPILYSNVDISWHNRGWVASGVPASYLPSEGMVWADTMYIYIAGRWAHVVQRQTQFLKAILKNPKYARFVRNFTWTIHFTANTKSKWAGSEVYKVMEMLTEVRRLDLAFDYCEPDPSRNPVPQSLFPKAEHIRLVGKTSYALVTAILHGEKAKLTSLCLDNLHDEGKGEDGQRFSRLSTIETPLFRLRERWPEDDNREFVLPGPMRRILPQLKDRCESLKTLLLRKVGHEHPQQEQFYPKGDEEVYDEWALFIKAVKPQILTVEQGRDSRWLWSRTERFRDMPGPMEPLRAQDIAPMDQRFKERLLPTLMKGWEGLRRLEVRGVSWEVMSMLTLKGVDLVVDEKARACDNGAAAC